MTPIAYINVEKRRLEFAEPIKWHTPTVANLDRIPLFTKEALAQEQEPVGYVVVKDHGKVNILDFDFDLDVAEQLSEGKYPAYTTPPQLEERNFCSRCGKRTNDIHTCTPPQRTWQGLTDKQTTQAIKSMPKGIKGWMIDWDLHDFSKAIEAKLKEKNT